MPSRQNKQDRFQEIVRDLAARFLSRESNRTSLITVTDVRANEKGTMVNILFTVLPENQENAALDFAKRQRGNFRQFVKDEGNLMRIPFFDFDIDRGEKSRQKIDAVSL
jgi:ribosome-binding factor A